MIEASHYDNLTAYAAINRIRCDDLQPYILKTSDGGATWTRAGVNRPDGTTSGVAYVPGSNPAMFVAVGQTGIAYTKDFGATWIHADTTTTYGAGLAGPSAGFFAGARGHVSVLAQTLR